jgi:hypothetical protein
VASDFRGFGAALRIAPYALGAMGANPPVVIDKTDGQIPRAAGEPSLSAALALLSVEEAADYKTWGSQEKLMFLSGYQYLATATAAGLRRVDGTSFDGWLTQGISVVLAAMQAAQDTFKNMPADLAAAADQAAGILRDASTKAEPRGIDFAKKYALLRDRAAWELATQNDLTVEFEILGTDPANPGLIYTRKIGEDKTPDYSAVFSTQTPKEFYQAGLSLQDKYEALGVTFKKLNTLGVNHRLGLGPALILAVLITILVAILAFFWLWNNLNEQNKLTAKAVDLIQSDSRLTASEKADKVLAIRRAEAFFTEVFGTSIPWVGILIGLGVAALAVAAYPYIARALEKKPADSRWPSWR